MSKTDPILLQIIRFFCLCIVIEKGSWSPTPLIHHQPKKRIPKQAVSVKNQSEWHKEWTISKGWVHNRSHLLTLGIDQNNEDQKEEADENSSVCTEDVEDLLSLETAEDFSLMFHQVCENYRENFPENPLKYSDLQLPQIYKERLLLDKEYNFWEQFWDVLKPKRVVPTSKCKFTENRLYSPENQAKSRMDLYVESVKPAPRNRTSLGQNIALNNTLNAKTNLHEEPIYECSEESLSIYNNPIYMPLGRYRGFLSNGASGRFFAKNLRLKTEKHIRRHIKVRVMMASRLSNFAKRFKSDKDVDFATRHKIWNAHDEQRRIGNGKTSIKLQNMRHGRLNVLRWLLWEAEFHGGTNKMPALEKATNNTTLALHYAAARGCLDCVRLLVDSSTDLSANTQMDNDVTPVYLAAQEGHLDVLKFLVLEAGGSLYVRAKDGMAPIHAASQMGCLNCVKWMIQEQTVDPNLRDGDGATPLHFAASRGHLETVKWLLKHGARLSLDKYGKSPINDAAENQQVECLNVLVQHGTSVDYKSSSDRSSKKSCSCTRKSEQKRIRDSNSVNSVDCNTCKPSPHSDTSEPFYLHSPSSVGRPVEIPHAPQDGLYINPMNAHRNSASVGSESGSSDSAMGESFYLHNPQEVIYNRVKDLFEATSTRQQSPAALTVKVEVHSSSSGAGSDENLSSSDLSERSADHDHDYEDIYLLRAAGNNNDDQVKDINNNKRSRSRDSGSHSRSGSVGSSNSSCNVLMKSPKKDANTAYKSNEFLPKPQKYERKAQEHSETKSEEENVEKTKLAQRHSVPVLNSKVLKRVTSVPGENSPPPPPPPPPNILAKTESRNNVGGEEEPRGAEVVEIVEEPTLRPSEIAKGSVRTMSALTNRRLNSSCSDLTIVSLATEDGEPNNSDTSKHSPNLVNKQRVLPFVPPSFPSGIACSTSNNLIKPSEYLRSISSEKRSSSASLLLDEMTVEEHREAVRVMAPPPPPPPEPQNFPSENNSEATPESKKPHQPLSAISIQDLNSVQLRRTDKMVATKTFSAPTRSVSLQCLQTEPFLAQKTDLIAELKMSKDITGIKKLKIERAKVEETKEKMIFTEITRQFTATNFVEKIPDKDNTGNVIPAWKRQMLAKKAAERARKELEAQMLKEAEEKKLQAIPQWKRQLMQKREETENKIKSTIYTPKVIDDNKVQQKIQEVYKPNNGNVEEEDANNNTMQAAPMEEEEEEEEEAPIMPWRAHLRKTNSKLNLLD